MPPEDLPIPGDPSYPPGVTGRDIDEHFGGEDVDLSRCDTCRRELVSCECGNVLCEKCDVDSFRKCEQCGIECCDKCAKGYLSNDPRTGTLSCPDCHLS